MGGGQSLNFGLANLDTFAWYSGRLVIGVFDDDTPGGPLEDSGSAAPADRGNATGVTASWATRAIRELTRFVAEVHSQLMGT